MEILGIILIIVSVLGIIFPFAHNILGGFSNVITLGMVKHKDFSAGAIIAWIVMSVILLIIGIVLVIVY